ncbi:MAG: hypothetical protein LiPW41_702 [Parcubacteria group bacterium LiPW_41]|nr:MAG: hypothetical protein LiPW41_702 [Parcubacteria group bacterium LiPW_41]
MKNYAIHIKNICSAFLCVTRLAEELKGRVATLMDLASIRAHDLISHFSWRTPLTPHSILVFGKHNGKRLIVVAHHLGPLTSKKRILEWAESASEKQGSDGLPSVSRTEFLNLINGNYGPVSIIPFDEYRDTFPSHLFGEPIEYKNAARDPLLAALFGPDTRKFLDSHYTFSSYYAMRNRKSEIAQKRILQLEIKDRNGVNLFSEKQCDFPDEPTILFLRLGGVSRYADHELGIMTTIETVHDLSQGTVVVCNDTKEEVVELSIDPLDEIGDGLIANRKSIPISFFALMRRRDKLFTQYPKEKTIDTNEPMYLVRTHEKIGDVVDLIVHTHCSPFLRYTLNDIIKVAPEGSNAYELCGEPKQVGADLIVPVQFFNITVTTKFRIPRKEEILNRPFLLLWINRGIIEKNGDGK